MAATFGRFQLARIGASFLLLNAVLCSSLMGVQNWAERLGFPPGSRVVILEAAQMGMCHESSQAIQAALEAGELGSAAVMAPCPWFHEAAAWSARNPQADVGLSVTLTSDYANYRWRPVSPRSAVESLVDIDGYCWRTPLQVGYHAKVDQVQTEIMAQIQLARASGIRPTHLTSHGGALYFRPDLATAYLRAAEKHWIPAVVVALTPAHLERFRRQGFPLSDEMIELVTHYTLPKIDDLQLTPVADTYEQKRDAMLQLIRDLKPGITLIHFRPANETDALKQLAPDWQQHVWDKALLSDAQVREAMQAEGVILTNWREIMQRFEGGLAQTPTAPPASEN